MDIAFTPRYKTSMAGVGALAVTAGAALLGVLIPTLANLWLTHETNAEARLFRNHEKRVAIAEEYLRAFGHTAEPSAIMLIRVVPRLKKRITPWWLRPKVSRTPLSSSSFTLTSQSAKLRSKSWTMLGRCR